MQLNDSIRDMLIEEIHAQLKDSPELIERCIPDYPVLGKRLLRDNGSWFAALQRDNVALVDEPITRISTHGTLTADGVERDYDAIVYATGFRASEYFLPMRIRGHSGVDLQEVWCGEPRAFLGLTIPGFPNFFQPLRP